VHIFTVVVGATYDTVIEILQQQKVCVIMADEDEAVNGSGEPNKDEKQYTLAKIIDWVTKIDPVQVEDYVNKLRSQNPGISDDALARKIIRRKSFKNGLVGAATGVGGILTLPVSVPSDVYVSWRIQVFMACSVAYTYGHTAETTDLKTDVYLILAGDAAKESLKRLGIEVGKSVTKKAVERYFTREVMKNLWAVMGQRVITKAGQKSLTSFTKMVPLVGAPIGYAFDWSAARGVGHFAIKYYSGGG
jgi:EcsC family protein